MAPLIVGDEYLATSDAWALAKPVTSMLEDNGLTYHAGLVRGPNDGVYILDPRGTVYRDQATMHMGEPYTLVDAGPRGDGVRIAERGFTAANTGREGSGYAFSPSIWVYLARVVSCEAPDNYIVQPWYVELWVSAGVWEDFGARERVYDATQWPALEGMQTNLPPEATYVPEGIYTGFRRLAIFPIAAERGAYGRHHVATRYDIHVSVPDGAVGELEIAAAHYTLLSRRGEHFVLGLQATVLASTCDPAREGAVETMAQEPHEFATTKKVSCAPDQGLTRSAPCPRQQLHLPGVDARQLGQEEGCPSCRSACVLSCAGLRGRPHSRPGCHARDGAVADLLGLRHGAAV